jgi:hypothetical protein
VGHTHDVSDRVKPAFYAAEGGPWRQWWTILHPPYTAWHLAYVVIGGCLAQHVDWSVLGLTVLAFALALGLGAHALDEWHGRPLGTTVPGWSLLAVTVSSVAAACVIGIVVSSSTTWWLLVTIVIGAALVPVYNLELFGGVLHVDLGFGLAWGAFPVVTAYLAQTGTVRIETILVAGWATVLALAQRRLSTAARWARREVVAVHGTAVLRDGSSLDLDRARLLSAPESALRLLTIAVVLLAAGLVGLRL